jgi:hypothetical protein
MSNCTPHNAARVKHSLERIHELHHAAIDNGSTPLELAIILAVTLRSLLADTEWRKGWEDLGEAAETIHSKIPLEKGAEMNVHKCDCLAATVLAILGPLAETN